MIASQAVVPARDDPRRSSGWPLPDQLPNCIVDLLRLRIIGREAIREVLVDRGARVEHQRGLLVATPGHLAAARDDGIAESRVDESVVVEVGSPVQLEGVEDDRLQNNDRRDNEKEDTGAANKTWWAPDRIVGYRRIRLHEDEVTATWSEGSLGHSEPGRCR